MLHFFVIVIAIFFTTIGIRARNILTLSAHTQEGHSTPPVCLFFFFFLSFSVWLSRSDFGDYKQLTAALGMNLQDEDLGPFVVLLFLVSG